jgi:ppGpp synthetase/RelA/SpoT-type nucleotidyltranferase
MTDPELIERLKRQYNELSPWAEALCAELSRQININFMYRNISLGFPVQYRVKTWNSIEEKMRRVALRIKSVTDLQDIIGVRVILVFPTEIENVIRCLIAQFAVIKQVNTITRLNDDQFGYTSHHLIVDLNNTQYLQQYIPANARLKGEIQVRTLAQHIWAEASHKINYKNNQLPVTINRSIYRLSALLETVDLELQRIVQEISELPSLPTQNAVDPAVKATNDIGELVYIKIDIDGDGQLETITPSSVNGQTVSAWKEVDGDVRSIEVEVGGAGSSVRDVVLTDIDNDGKEEIVCKSEFDNYTALTCYKYQDGVLRIIRLSDTSGMFPDDHFPDGHIEDYDNDGQFEIVCSPWDVIPKDLLPETHKEGDYDWGRVDYIWKWNVDSLAFLLVKRVLSYIGTR